jgi:hypothetical protein
MTSDQSGDWRSLAEKATKETDANKMLAIITELNRVLEGEQTVHQQQRLRQRPSSAKWSDLSDLTQ